MSKSKKLSKKDIEESVMISLVGGYMILGVGNIFDQDKNEWKYDSSVAGRVIIGDSFSRENIKVSYTNLLLIRNAIDEHIDYIKHYYGLEEQRRKRNQDMISTIVF